MKVINKVKKVPKVQCNVMLEIQNVNPFRPRRVVDHPTISTPATIWQAKQSKAFLFTNARTVSVLTNFTTIVIHLTFTKLQVCVLESLLLPNRLRYQNILNCLGHVLLVYSQKLTKKPKNLSPGLV